MAYNGRSALQAFVQTFFIQYCSSIGMVARRCLLACLPALPTCLPACSCCCSAENFCQFRYTIDIYFFFALHIFRFVVYVAFFYSVVTVFSIQYSPILFWCIHIFSSCWRCWLLLVVILFYTISFMYDNLHTLYSVVPTRIHIREQ